MGMVFTLVEAAKEWLTDHSSSMHDKMVQRLTSEHQRTHDYEEEQVCCAAVCTVWIGA